MSVDLSERYGTNRPRQRALLLAVSAVLGVAFLVWLGWIVWFHSTPEVSSDLSTYKVVDAHKAEVVVQVHLAEDVDARCKVRALAADHVVVGEENFTPVDGRNDVEIRTEREATSVELVGCTAPGQNRPG
ncbi:DUF4307 domain-containing protein [Nocardioides jensenii]|uniref:DUF4307 domain-containing protein n=1 Tax=Nocardioides jensenii TaxID=1843 RepID=UPI00146FCFD2|nr:DUF4307 domain-containing protein [Nocardioides jensenii]